MSNIFILDEDIRKSAEYHADQHVISGLAEIARMVAFSFSDDILKKFEQRKVGLMDKFSAWVNNSKGNFEYAIQLWELLHQESCIRFDMPYNRTHRFIQHAKNNPPKFLNKDITPFETAFPLGSKARQLSKYESDVIKLYRESYREKKFLTWGNGKPDWI